MTLLYSLDEFFLSYALVLYAPMFFFTIIPFTFYVWNNLLNPLKAGNSFVLFTTVLLLCSYAPTYYM